MEQESKLTLNKREQNLIAVCIILGGLFLGSLFVDFFQLVSGSGFSARVVKKINVLESAGKTWVGYNEPRVDVSVITDDACITCDPNEALVWLRRVIPTIEAAQIDFESDRGKELISRFDITTLPAFVFSDSVSETDFFAQASSLFRNVERTLFFDMAKIGLQPGKYLKLPEIGENAIVRGNENAKVTVIEYSDFECVYCRTFHKDVMAVLNEYKDEVRYVYKTLPLSFNPQAENAALAGYCAKEQGKFDTYADYLFGKQGEWSNTEGKQKFKDYAWWLGLNGRQFSSCMDTEKYRSQVEEDRDEAERFAIPGTPGTFVNGIFLSGAITKEELKQIIDQERNK